MDAERALVSKVINTGDIETVISRGINEDHFADEECEKVYMAIIKHTRKYKTPPSASVIKDRFPDFEFELSKDSIEYIIDRFIVTVKKRLAKQSVLALAEAAEDPDRAEEIDIEFLDISRELAQVVPSTTVARFSDMDGRIEKYHIDKKEGTPWGIKMGIPPLDEKTFGIQEHELVVAAGFQGRGKSTLMQHIGFNAYLQNKLVLMVSLEMESKPLLRKFDTMAVDMSYRDLKAMELGDESVKRWKQWADDAKAGRDHGKDIIIVDRIASRTPMGIFAETVRHKPDLVIVDYISLLETQKTGSDQHWQQIGAISRELKLNARTLGVPVIAAAQTNRESVKEGVKLETIAFSGSIGMDADIVLGLNQDDDMKENDQMEVVMIKNRDGAPGKATLNWDMSNMQFGERPQFMRSKKSKVKRMTKKKEDKQDNNPFRKNK